MSRLLMCLIRESGLKKFDSVFYQWCRDQYNIVDLRERTEHPAVVTGIELDEEVLTMLRLKYPGAFTSLRLTVSK